MPEPSAPSLRPVTLKECANFRWRIPTDHQHVSFIPTVMLSAPELPLVSLELPWAFIETNGVWRAISILKTSQQAACPWLGDDGKLALAHIPFLLRMYPFSILPDGAGQVLALWDDPDCVGEIGQALFQGEELSPSVKPVAQAFAKFFGGLELVNRLGKDLYAAGLLKQSVMRAKGESQLYDVDETLLRQCRPDLLSKLSQNGALGTAYAQILSQHHQKSFLGTKASSNSFRGSVLIDQDQAFLGALTDDLLEGLHLKPGALAP